MPRSKSVMSTDNPEPNKTNHTMGPFRLISTMGVRDPPDLRS